ncbi:uncharacterized protein [Montipora foliosa]|uniref:uncharacterized protein isoform X1 n=1 Tax=Montipora foliosa TaxID=591990 RepID=UPI0035F20713
MDGPTCIEVFGNIIFRFTRSVSEQYSPKDPEYSQETLEYTLLQNTGREWYAQPVDEIIYQEYSDKKVTVDDFLPASCTVQAVFLDACSPGDIEEQDKNNEADLHQDMSWKQLRPSALRTVCESTVVGALISLLSAIAIGMFFTMISYLSYKTFLNCHFEPKTFIPLKLQWMQVTCNIISCFFLYIWVFLLALVLFRSYQLSGVKKKLFLCCILMYFLDSLYRVTLQALGISKSFPLSNEQVIPLNILFVLSIVGHNYLLANHLCFHSKQQKRAAFLLCSVIYCLPFIGGIIVSSCIYPVYNKQNEKHKLIIALFSPLIMVVFKTTSRICVQRLWRLTHPAYSYAMMAPLYAASAIMFRVMQVDLGNLKAIAYLGIIHGVAEVIERTTVVVIDHICQRILNRASAPWGRYRTPRTERITADIAIMSMLYESTAIVSINGFFHLYQFIYMKNISFWLLLVSFTKLTAVPLLIEWLSTSLSLAIETRFQNLAVMAVWRKDWKRHILVAVLNLLPMAVWTSQSLFSVVQARFEANLDQASCKMPFS